MQAARLLPVVRGPAHGADRRSLGELRHPRVPVRQWVLSLPIPLRLLLAAQTKLVPPVLQVMRRVITRFLLKQAGVTSASSRSTWSTARTAVVS